MRRQPPWGGSVPNNQARSKKLYWVGKSSRSLGSIKYLFKINRALSSIAVEQPVHPIAQVLKRQIRTQWLSGPA